jgi:hypothetical protein
VFRFRLFKTRKEPESADADYDNEATEYDYHISQVFMGHHSIVTLVGFTVGGILVGRGLYEVLIGSIGVYGTIGVGLMMFAATGLYIGSFRG